MNSFATPARIPTITNGGRLIVARMRARRRTALAAVVWLLAVVLSVGTNGMAGAQTAPPPADDPAETRPAVDLPHDGDPTTPVAVLPPLIEELTRLAAQPAPRGDAGRRTRVGHAATSATQALIEYTDDSSDIPAVIKELTQSARFLQVPAGPQDAVARRLDAIAAAMAGVARTFAVNMLDRATTAGVDRGTIAVVQGKITAGDSGLAAGDAAGAAHQYGQGFDVASGSTHFDLDTFEAGIRIIGTRVVGYAYSITANGLLVREDAEGDARTEADDPQTDHSPDREQHLASVSKTITAVAMLRALQDKGISPEAPIAPYLPLTWLQGTNLSNLTFRHLFNHQSGILTSQGNTYEALRTRIATPFPALPASYDYSNANFGLMRILLPRVSGSADKIDWLDSWDSAPDGTKTASLSYANSFEFYVQTQIFAPIGISGACIGEVVDTLQYNFPHGDQPGYEEPSRLLSCGGFGWNLSSNELAKFMVNLRYTSTLLSSEYRKLMDTMFLGWSDPTRFGWSTGDFGLYHNHGGDWSHSSGEAHTCIMKFNIKVEVALVINSQRNFARHQCTILRDAFDAAWIA